MKTFLYLFLLVFSTNLYSKNIFSDSIPLLNNSNIESKVYYTEANRGYAIEDMHLKLDSNNLDSNSLLFITIDKVSMINENLNYYSKVQMYSKHIFLDLNKNFMFNYNLRESDRYLIKGYIEYTIEIFNGKLKTTVIHKSKIYVN